MKNSEGGLQIYLQDIYARLLFSALSFDLSLKAALLWSKAFRNNTKNELHSCDNSVIWIMNWMVEIIEEVKPLVNKILHFDLDL